MREYYYHLYLFQIRFFLQSSIQVYTDSPKYVCLHGININTTTMCKVSTIFHSRPNENKPRELTVRQAEKYTEMKWNRNVRCWSATLYCLLNCEFISIGQTQFRSFVFYYYHYLLATVDARTNATRQLAWWGSMASVAHPEKREYTILLKSGFIVDSNKNEATLQTIHGLAIRWTNSPEKYIVYAYIYILVYCSFQF